MKDQSVTRIEVLEKIAKALGVTAEGIKNFDEETVFNIISNTFTSIAEKIVELYKGLLQTELEKTALLDNILKEK